MGRAAARRRGLRTLARFSSGRPHPATVDFQAAAEYAERHTAHAMVAVRDGATVFERFADGYDAGTPHALYSGTKSFWGPLALAAVTDGLIALDEPVSATFAAWADGRRAGVTLRSLLSLTAGIPFGGLGAGVPTYEKALAVEPTSDAGRVFTYGGIPLQVFGAVLARKLAPRRLTPQTYLQERLFEPLGMRVAAWRSLRDGSQPLPTGASVAAKEWLKFGAFVLSKREELAPCFSGTSANPRYGLTWWLSPLESVPDIVYASGAGGQALYIIPSERLVVVRFGKSGSYDHAAFLRRLLSSPRLRPAAS